MFNTTYSNLKILLFKVVVDSNGFNRTKHVGKDQIICCKSCCFKLKHVVLLNIALACLLLLRQPGFELPLRFPPVISRGTSALEGESVPSQTEGWRWNTSLYTCLSSRHYCPKSKVLTSKHKWWASQQLYSEACLKITPNQFEKFCCQRRHPP